jgi:uncharacterized protein with NRDE domain
MCLLALFFRAVADTPLVVAANREEFYQRGGEPPQILDGPVRAVGGRDPQAGGTWFGVNARGVVVAITNRPLPVPPPQARSRGLLVRDLLGCTTAKAAVDVASRELASHRYAGCNLLCADRERAVILEAAEWLRVRPLPPGLHVLTNHDINDGSDPRVHYALDWLSQRDYATAKGCLQALQNLCSQGSGDHPPMCLHGTGRGTVSSTVLALRLPLTRSIYLHAQGPPDQVAYEDCSALLHELAYDAPR